MASKEHLPEALRQHMNQDKEIVAISAWATTADKEILEGPLPKSTPYDKQRSQFVDTILDIKVQCLIKEHQRLNQGNKFWDEFDPETCTWQEVFDAVEGAEAEYEGKASRVSIRRVFRSEALVRNATPLLEGIPERDGLGFLKGGLIILFNAIKRRTEARNNILETLGGVPNIIIDAQQKRKRFPLDVPLFTRTNDLYIALFEAVPLLIEILNRSSSEPRYKKVGRSIVGNEVLQVADILRPVISAQRAVEQIIARLTTERDDQDSKLLRSARVELGVLRKNELLHHDETSKELRSSSQKSERIEDKLDKCRAEVARYQAENVALCNEFRREIRQVYNALYVIHAESHRTRAFCRDQKQSTFMEDTCLTVSFTPKDGELHNTEQPPPAYHESTFDPGHILAALCSGEEIKSHVHDFYLTLRKHHDFSDKALAQAAYLTNMDRFRRWQGERDSDILLVDGHAGSESNGRTTAMSVFCATLVQSLKDINTDSSVSAGSFIVLYFFCGQHKDPDSRLPGPSGMMRSLIVQLILAWPEGRQQDLQSIKQLSEIKQSTGSSKYQVSILCQIFEELLWQLPPRNVVHGIIDGISHFETSIRGWSTDMRTIASSLETCATRLRGAGENSSVLKMLLASAGKSTVVRDLIPREGQVSLRSGNFLAQPTSPRSLSQQLSRQASSEEPSIDTQAESSRCGHNQG
ncbi:hypothetical protein VMCG_01916 [Cytospora schulzeri]|uniref:Nephrocystin 3-like N-terminal domain-containing protein n=1 Tax=Cytospora schulzeri TaxID=448051 RepID=A0A423X430_9PEZI|nr:hypothetical protein VMCG_01916 [Valsa malicola]